MSNITLRSSFDVELVDVMGSDDRVCQSARISNLGAKAEDTEASANLIKFLMAGRHGSPFESCVMQFMISAPIFVWREFHRHRIASYSEQSSRWMQLEPVFYLPSVERPTKKKENTRKGDYAYELAEYGSDAWKSFMDFRSNLISSCERAYTDYDWALKNDVAGEVARMLLPVNIYSTCYVTMNLRGLMNFLSLRMANTAQYEIRQVAKQMEAHFHRKFPLVNQAWHENGMIAP